jgi:hypothetical protein
MNSFLFKVRHLFGIFKKNRKSLTKRKDFMNTTLKEMIKKDSALPFLFSILSPKSSSRRSPSRIDNSSIFISQNKCFGCCYSCKEDCSFLRTNKQCSLCNNIECVYKENICPEKYECDFCRRNCLNSPSFNPKQFKKDC